MERREQQSTGPTVNSAAEIDASPVPFPVVGIGASAGGLEAFTQLLGHLPADTGMAFVFIQHLDPKHESQLADLLAKATSMPVVEARSDQSVRPNHVYVIPPGQVLLLDHGALRLQPLPAGRARHVVVDVLFRTLADSHGAHAAAVVLSGMDSDGAIGIKRIKERGGLTVAQDPDQAQHRSMPQ